jgi:hypothetical protein
LPNRNEIGGGAARTARTLANEESILNIVEEDGTRSIREIAQEVNISSRSVHRVLNENRLHPFHYTRVQHLEPEGYPARRNFCVWLLNKAAEDENFISRILFSDESSFGRQGCSKGYLSACISAPIFRKFVVRTSGRFSGKSRL